METGMNTLQRINKILFPTVQKSIKIDQETPELQSKT